MRIRTIPSALGLAALSLAGGAGSAVAAGDDDGGTGSAGGSNARQSVGDSITDGTKSVQLAAVQGSLNKLCVGLPVKANVQDIVGIIAQVGVQDVPVLSAPQNQQCVDDSTQAKADEPLSHVADDIPAASGNGTGDVGS
ncbi:RdlA protein OS=Streptomyces alboniger OX=132473 GN=CP975_18780 PE=4 SV=1 [Streptomyces alboniger]